MLLGCSHSILNPFAAWWFSGRLSGIPQGEHLNEFQVAGPVAAAQQAGAKAQPLAASRPPSNQPVFRLVQQKKRGWRACGGLVVGLWWACGACGACGACALHFPLVLIVWGLVMRHACSRESNYPSVVDPCEVRLHDQSWGWGSYGTAEGAELNHQQ